MTVLELEYIRPLLESEIERLIGLLDLLEPDPDFEDGDPDFEDGADLEEDTADDEPFIGSPEQQSGYWSGVNFFTSSYDGEELGRVDKHDSQSSCFLIQGSFAGGYRDQRFVERQGMGLS